MKRYFTKSGTSEGAVLAWESRQRAGVKPEVDPYQGGRGGWAAHKKSREILSGLSTEDQIKSQLKAKGFFDAKPDPDKYRAKERAEHRDAMIEAVKQVPPEKLDDRAVPTLMEAQAVMDAYEREKGGPPSFENDQQARGAVKLMGEREDSLSFRGKPRIEARIGLLTHALSRANAITDWKNTINLALAYEKHGGENLGVAFRNRGALLYSKEQGFNPGGGKKAEKSVYFPEVTKEDSNMDQKKVDELRREVVRMVTSGEKTKKSVYFPNVNKAGTSEGAKLAWESRRRAEGKRDELGAKLVPVDPKKLQAQAKREGAALPGQRAHIQDLVGQAIRAQAEAKKPGAVKPVAPEAPPPKAEAGRPSPFSVGAVLEHKKRLAQEAQRASAEAAEAAKPAKPGEIEVAPGFTIVDVAAMEKPVLSESSSPKNPTPRPPVSLPGGTNIPGELHDLANKVVRWANTASGASAGAAGAYAGSLLRDPMSSESAHAVHVQLLYIRRNMAGWKGPEGRAARQEMDQHIKDFEAKADKSADGDASDLFRTAMPKWVSPCSRVAAPNPKSKRPM